MSAFPRPQMRVAWAVVLAAVACFAGPAGASEDRLQVYAAASLQEVIEAAADLYETQGGEEVIAVYAGSGGLARQIAAGAPADVFISANEAWVDWLAAALPDVPPARHLAGNTLVVIVPDDRAIPPGAALDPELFGDRVAMGLIDAVPAGIYGKQALETLGFWPALAPRVVQTENVRVALALVASGAASSGIVYRSDAQAEPRVRVVATFPEGSHDKIRYPALQIEAQGAAFLDLLLSEEGQALFAAFGFRRSGEPDR